MLIAEIIARLVDTHAAFSLENMLKDVSQVRALVQPGHCMLTALFQFDDLFGGVFDGDEHAFQASAPRYDMSISS